LTNSRVTASSIVQVSVQSRCTGGLIYVASVDSSTAGMVNIEVINTGSFSCTSTYALNFVVFA
jgi:hypothetical protein